MGPCPPEKSTPTREKAHALACGFGTLDTHACTDAAAPAFKVRVLAQLMAGTTARPPLTPPEIGGLHPQESGWVGGYARDQHETRPCVPAQQEKPCGPVGGSSQPESQQR